MSWVFFQIKESSFLSPSYQPYFLPQSLPPPPPSPIPNSQSTDFNLNKVSPSILLIIIILAIIFFISGLFHLLIRFILRPPNRDPDDFENVTAHQGQLQQLFNLHDSGVDQSFIDTLPVFNYKSIVGVKNPFDCAVCLCEFEGEDKLRLLPKCSHAFHMECIDIWLLSHSTCPLCRACLVPDFSPSNRFSPLVLVLESGSESSSRDSVCDRDGNSYLGFDEFGSTRVDFSGKSCEIQEKIMGGSEEKVVIVKLGKFKNVDNGGECSSSISSNNVNVDERRCFSMGSFEYVMDENSKLQVPIRTPMKKPPSKKPNLPLTPGLRLAMSECDCDSRRDFNGFEPFKSVGNSSEIGGSKRESFSISKIWVRGKKDRPVVGSSRRAVSFRFPAHWAGDDLKVKNGGGGTRRTVSEIDMSRLENGERELGSDHVEIQRCANNSLENQANAPSFARRTLLWLVGRQNKVVHSSFPPNV